MMFTVGSIPTISDEERKIKTSDAFLQKVLVKTILIVSNICCLLLSLTV